MTMNGSKTTRDAQRAPLAKAASRSDDTAVRVDYWLDIALEDSFPCSDPMSSMRAD
jgi:hypothetical protein